MCRVQTNVAMLRAGMTTALASSIKGMLQFVLGLVYVFVCDSVSVRVRSCASEMRTVHACEIVLCYDACVLLVSRGSRLRVVAFMPMFNACNYTNLNYMALWGQLW